MRPFVTVQNEYSLLAREARDEVLPACERLGISFMPYFPLASRDAHRQVPEGGAVAAGSRMAGPGGWDEFLTDERFELGERLAAFAERHGHSLLELALSWLASQRPVATVIAGATSAPQVRDNAAAVEAWKMSDEELAELDELLG